MTAICLYCKRPIDRPGRADRVFCSPSHKSNHYRREDTAERILARQSLRDGSFIRSHQHLYDAAVKLIDRQLRTLLKEVKGQKRYRGYRLAAVGADEILLPKPSYPLINPDETTRLNHLGKRVKTDYFLFFPAELPLVPVSGWYTLIFVSEIGETDAAEIRNQSHCAIGMAIELPGCRAVPKHAARKSHSK